MTTLDKKRTAVAKLFGEYSRTPAGRSVISGGAVIISHETETIRSVTERARQFPPPVSVAVGAEGEQRLTMISIEVDVDDPGEEHLDPVSPDADMGMLLDYVRSQGGHCTFRSSEWDPFLSAESIPRAAGEELTLV